MWKYYLLGGFLVGSLAFAISMSRGRSIATSALGAVGVGVLVFLLQLAAVESGRGKARLREERLRKPLAKLVKLLESGGLSAKLGRYGWLTIQGEAGNSFRININYIEEVFTKTTS